MKRVLFFLVFSLFLSQQFANCSIPIQIKKLQNGDEGAKGGAVNINVEVIGDTVTVSFNSNCGEADVIIETPSGSYVASAYCSSTPGFVDITLSSGFYVITITTGNGIYQGQLIIN